MRLSYWSHWDTLVPITGFFGQSLAVLITFTNHQEALSNRAERTYLPVFFWR